MMISSAVNTQGFVRKFFLIYFLCAIYAESVFLLKNLRSQWLAIAVSIQEYVLVKVSTQTIACHFRNQLTMFLLKGLQANGLLLP